MLTPNRQSIVRAALFAVAILICGTADAQQPKLEMHRVGVSADDGSGWHLAVSTKGSFAISTPIPFNDFTTHDPSTGDTTHAVGGKSSEGIKVVAVEAPITARTPADLGAIPKSFSSTSGNKVSDVSRSTKEGTDVLTFSVTNAASTAYIRYVKTNTALYTLTIEGPNAHRDLAAALKDRFFGSFQLKGKP